jgi:NAD+ kinase
MDAWKPDDDEVVVGVVEFETPTSDRFAAAVDSLRDDPELDVTIVADSLGNVLASDPSLVVAAGEVALSAVARRRCSVPILPMGDVAGIDAAAFEQLSDALRAALSDTMPTRSRSVLGVTLDGEAHRALFDVTLVTEEPARISEYGVRSRDASVASFRADGVTVATPAGTHGYAGAVDAPVLSAAVDAVAIAPIAPFATRTRQWVVPEDGIELTVERDEGAVCLVVDGRSVATVPVGPPVRLGVEGTLRVLVPPPELQR